MSAHAECSHDASKSARARCRRSKRQVALTDAEKRAESYASVLREKGWDVRVEITDYTQDPCLAPRRYASLRAYEERGVYASINGMWMSILPNDMGRRESTKFVSGEIYRSYAKQKRMTIKSPTDFAHWVYILA